MYNIKFTNSKRIKEAYTRYLDSSIFRLSQCYSKFSYVKEQAENDILYYLTNLTDEYIKPYKIIGYNNCSFSCGAIVQLNGRVVFLYFTSYNTYGLYLD